MGAVGKACEDHLGCSAVRRVAANMRDVRGGLINAAS